MAEPVIRDINTVFGFWASRPVDISLQALCGILDKQGVTRAATLSTVGIFVDSRRGNDLTWRAAEEDSRLLPAATVDPRLGPECLEELAERIEQGFRLVALFPGTQGWTAEHACCGEILRLCAEAEAAAMVEASAPGAPTVIARLAERCGTRVVLSGVGYRNLGEALAVAKPNPNIYLETHLLTSVDGIERVVEHLAPERVLFGSGAPLRYFSSAHLRLRFADLAEGERAAVQGGNFAALLEGASANH